MERRKILLGSGAALATVLAGCSSTETGEELSDDTDDDPSDDGASYDDGDDDYDDGDDHDEIPGFDGGIETDSDKLTVTEVSRDGDSLGIAVQTEVTDTDELYKELEDVGHDLAYAISDSERFKAEVDVIELYLERDGAHVVGLFIDVEWALDYLEGEISREELGKKIVDTKEE
ncbi:hypothetical protein EA462_12115 [Natrarchaeobius halalkaliphilus]|uniref:DUF8159 domain-containing protein n=1 Tax=Natrarchaeobius halalkaliphilus TaxID=1679091 RepID=A0A3N6M1Y9_9EURY|nr:hypothetical protein [Natrarchaeobius halalkaliphilus]RQG89111.1 hypothetical protein EA462_12115 [Natrarchaeobius halalkaliphilus]